MAAVRVLPQVAEDPDQDPVERGKEAGAAGQGEQRGPLRVSLAPPSGCFSERGGELARLAQLLDVLGQQLSHGGLGRDHKFRVRGFSLALRVPDETVIGESF